MPMKRSRVFTRQAMTRENVRKNAAPSMTTRSTPRRERGLPVHAHAEEKREKVDDDRLREAAQAGGNRLAQHERCARGGADEELVEDPQVPLPDHRDSVEDRDEQHALGKDPRRHEIDVAHVPRRDGADAREHLAEDQEPQRGLNRARQQLGGIVEKLARLHARDRERLRDVAKEKEKRIGAGENGLSRACGWTCGCVWSHDMCLRFRDCSRCNG